MTDSAPTVKREPKLVPADEAPVKRIEPDARTADDTDTEKPASTPDTSETESPKGEIAVASEEEAKPKRKIGRTLTRFVLLLVIPLIAIAAGVWFYVHGGRYIKTENAYVKTNIIAVSADIEGRVVEVMARDNEPVASGAVLFRLDDAPYRLAVTEAEAEMQVVESDVESIRANYREALNEEREHQSRIKFLEREHQRQKRLRDRGIGTEQAYDRARTELEIARDQIDVIRERSARVLATLGGKADMPAQEHPKYARSIAAREVAMDRLKRTIVRAPTAGIVSNMKLQPGEWVNDGQPVFSLLQSDSLWIEANLKETQLTHITENQEVSFVVDAYPDYNFKARVAHIAPATGAEFSLLPPQNATGNWVKVVQRVPVTLEIVPDEQSPTLRAGMTATVSIDTKRNRDLPGVVQEFARGLNLPESVLQYLGMGRQNDSNS